MAHEHAARFERQIIIFAAHFRRLCEQEVRDRLGNFEPAQNQLRADVFAHAGDLEAVRLVVCAVCKRRKPRRLRHGIDVVGVRGVFDLLQIGDEPRLRDGEPQARARHGAAFGERPHDQKIVVFLNQRQAAFRAEVDVGLVDHDNAVRVARDEPLDLFDRKREPRRRVRVGDDDHAGFSDIIVDADGEILPKGNFLVRHAVKLGVDGVEPVGHVGIQRAVIAVAKRHERKVQNVVRPVGDEDVFALYAVGRRERLAQLFRRGVGIKLQAFRRLRRRADRVLGGREGGFVGVQFDILLILRLFSGGVGLQRPEAFAQKTAQNSSTSGSMRMTALLA